MAIPHLKNVVHKCLENLSNVGLLHRIDSERFSVFRQRGPKPGPSLIQPDILEEFEELIKCSRKRKFSDTIPHRGGSQLLSEKSSTDDEDERTAKRLPTYGGDILHIGDKKPLFKIFQNCCSDNFPNIIHARNEVVISSQSNSSSVQTLEEISRATADKTTSTNIINESHRLTGSNDKQ